MNVYTTIKLSMLYLKQLCLMAIWVNVFFVCSGLRRRDELLAAVELLQRAEIAEAAFVPPRELMRLRLVHSHFRLSVLHCVLLRPRVVLWRERYLYTAVDLIFLFPGFYEDISSVWWTNMPFHPRTLWPCESINFDWICRCHGRLQMVRCDELLRRHVRDILPDRHCPHALRQDLSSERRYVFLYCRTYRHLGRSTERTNALNCTVKSPSYKLTFTFSIKEIL